MVILEELSRMMNFTIEPIFPPDHKHGALEEDNKTYNGMLGSIQRGEALFTGSSLHLVESRARDFELVVSYAFLEW